MTSLSIALLSRMSTVVAISLQMTTDLHRYNNAIVDRSKKIDPSKCRLLYSTGVLDPWRMRDVLMPLNNNLLDYDYI